MGTATAHTWTCPSCGRRVPLRAEACHCGMTRARAAELALARPAVAAAPRVTRGAGTHGEAFKAMGGDVKLLLATAALVLLAGFAYLLFAPPPQPYPAVLGHVDAGPPKAAQQARNTRPPFKLPWWK
jgi:hypothetical protein